MPVASRLSRALIVLAVPVLALAAWRDAAAEYWLQAGPERAPALLLGEDSRLQRAKLDPATFDEAGQTDAFWRQVPGTARSALRSAPLDAAAVRQIGLAAKALEQPEAIARIGLAERISRRDAPTQAILLWLAASNQDYRATFMHLDTILTTSPPAGQQMFAPMATLLGDPQVRHELAGYGHRAWFGLFATTAARDTDSPADLAALLLASKAPASGATLEALPRLLPRLLDAGDYAAARKLALRFGKATPQALDDFAMSPASADPRFAPLTWKLADAEGVDIGVTPDRALDVRLRPGLALPLAERATALKPGAYAIEQRAGRGDGQGTLLVAWELYCQRAERPERVWRQPLPMPRDETRYRAQFEVPADCPLQFWRLTGLADETQSEAHFTIAGLRIAPAARPSAPPPALQSPSSTRTMLR